MRYLVLLVLFTSGICLGDEVVKAPQAVKKSVAVKAAAKAVVKAVPPAASSAAPAVSAASPVEALPTPAPEKKRHWWLLWLG